MTLSSGSSDTHEELTIMEPTMNHMGAVERPMMEYLFPTVDGTISSIAKPTVQANNFQIQPTIIEIIRSSVQESLYDAWEHFKACLEDALIMSYLCGRKFKLSILVSLWLIELLLMQLQVMPSYAKFLKEVLSNKRKWEGGETVKLNEECLAILQNKLPPKLKDPGGIAEGVLVKVGTFIILVDFIVLDMEEDKNMPLIQGDLFLLRVEQWLMCKKVSSLLEDEETEEPSQPNVQGTHVRKKKFKDVDKRYHENNGLSKVDWERIQYYLEGTLPPPLESPLLLSQN
ncbi:hypothetical protein Sango_0266600 [Sesamum angolense]|uniref:Uncharacterized protein n=1 Tax=Sesamum angolense TaxID=2727404 RepID=A0AAE2C7J6_9LAMI|nr:hypothetical protein Sango_0266600 [Sesamum angolense]